MPIKFFIAPLGAGEFHSEYLSPVCSPDAVLPPGLKNLTLWTDVDYDYMDYDYSLTIAWYQTGQYSISFDVVEFLSSLSRLVGPRSHLPNIQEVSYRFRANDHGADTDYRCVCDEDYDLDALEWWRVVHIPPLREGVCQAGCAVFITGRGDDLTGSITSNGRDHLLA